MGAYAKKMYLIQISENVADMIILQEEMAAAQAKLTLDLNKIYKVLLGL